MKETRMNRLAWHEYQHHAHSDESVVFLPFGRGAQYP